ncbi:hypothetical protein [Brevibacillus laterosporus]|uniref:Uncharacterized protein n=1 Tax=Brevibacillus laterosporus TaxID=1465 RepID=A0AAP8QGR1_BRELA|nr:hypothetical protein [Brevibacillus laterosporus]PPB12907.1 hypothetical protein C4A77_00540 [Brevibacillus laterosporus]
MSSETTKKLCELKTLLNNLLPNELFIRVSEEEAILPIKTILEKQEVTIDEAMRLYLEGQKIVIDVPNVGSQVFCKEFGKQKFLDFTIEEIANAKWVLIIK